MPRDETTVSPTDEELARQAQQGCSASFEQLVRRFQVPLSQFLRYRSGPVDVEDLVQDTFVRAYENLHRYRDSRRFSTWLFTIGRRLSINRARRHRSMADSEALESVDSPAPPPEQVVANEESRCRLWRLAGDVLTERQHTAVWLYYVEDLPVRQIAHVLGRSSSAVKTLLFRARRRLLQEMASAEQAAASSDGRRRPKTSSNPTAAELTNG